MNLVKISYAAPMASETPEPLFNLPSAIVMETGQTLEIDNYFVDDQGEPLRGKRIERHGGGGHFCKRSGVGGHQKAEGRLCHHAHHLHERGRMTAYQLWGIKVSRKNRQTLEVRDQDSINAHGERPFPLTINALSDPTTAQTIANLELERRKTPIGVVRRAEFINANDGGGHVNVSPILAGTWNLVRVKMTEEFGA